MNPKFETIGLAARPNWPRPAELTETRSLAPLLFRWVALGHAGAAAAFMGVDPVKQGAAEREAAALGGHREAAFADRAGIHVQAALVKRGRATQVGLVMRDPVFAPRLPDTASQRFGAAATAVFGYQAHAANNVSVGMAKVAPLVGSGVPSVAPVAPVARATAVQAAMQTRQQMLRQSKTEGATETALDARSADMKLTERLSRFALLPPAGASGFDTRMGPDWHGVGSFG